MKKRLFFLLVPLFLLGAIFWMRDRAFKKTEADFRHDVKSWIKEIDPTIHVSVRNTKAYPQFSESENQMWNTSDFLSMVERIHLTRSQSSFPKEQSLLVSLREEPLLFVSLSSGGSVGEPEGFYLSLKEDRGWMDIPAAIDYRNNWKDKGYELAPQTCRDFKQSLLSFQNR